MIQFLPRGYRVSAENRIKKCIADGNDWQIYLTNVDTFVLAVKPDLYRKWVNDCSLPEGIFTNELDPQYWIFQSSGHYLISSLEQGPYPEDDKQIEAFSIAFKTATTILKDIDVFDAIYIEEYSFILPVSFTSNVHELSTVYGRWISGGITISIDSIDRVSKIMTWLPKDNLLKMAKLAGFKGENADNLRNDEIENDEQFHIESNDNAKTVPIYNEQMPEKKFSLIGRPALEQFFNDNIIDIVLHQEQYKRMGITFPGATILYGPPGCGKTYAVEKLAEYLGWPRFDIDSSTIGSSYIHETGKKISEMFQSAIKAAPSILVIDEMEAFLSDRSKAGPTGTHRVEEVAEFLRRIPEAISKGVLVFAMTNMLDAIDPAILRRGRFDNVIEVKMANTEEIEVLLKAKFETLPVESNIDTHKIATALSGHPMSDVTFVMREAGRFAVKHNLTEISNACLDEALNLLPHKEEKNKIGF